AAACGNANPIKVLKNMDDLWIAPPLTAAAKIDLKQRTSKASKEDLGNHF
ncbi:MAG: hypothetical protein RL001_1425, partial [Pseudomonadota bacterium]